ncbi:tetratricopeptide repeat protein [Micromonospora sp. URMC 106]|uniref:tetratricopeptide repeat protein n=1 Tax=Micromonospora sp. URMC 106 TaxID=3423408 RepID=UPI003F1B7BB8
MSDAGVAAQERAQALSRVGRHAEAAQVLRGALAEQPHHAGLLVHLARCHRSMGQLAEAMRLVDQALGVARTQEHLLAEKARILLAAGHPGYAAAAAQRALELAPRSWEAHALFAEALLTLGNPTRVVVARRHADTARAIRHDVPDVHLLDARIHLRMGRLRAARQACGQALVLDPAYEPALALLARMDASKDRVGRAARGLTDALAANPQARWAAGAHEAVAAALCWRLFDAGALAGAGHWALFALVGGGQPVRLAAAVALLAVVAGAAPAVWRRQPPAVRRQLRRQLGTTSVVLCLALTAAALGGLLVSGLAPGRDTPAGGVAALLLMPAGAVLALRAWRQLTRRAVPVVRWVGYRIWTRLVARADAKVPAGTGAPPTASAPGAGAGALGRAAAGAGAASPAGAETGAVSPAGAGADTGDGRAWAPARR